SGINAPGPTIPSLRGFSILWLCRRRLIGPMFADVDKAHFTIKVETRSERGQRGTGAATGNSFAKSGPRQGCTEAAAAVSRYGCDPGNAGDRPHREEERRSNGLSIQIPD